MQAALAVAQANLDAGPGRRGGRPGGARRPAGDGQGHGRLALPAGLAGAAGMDRLPRGADAVGPDPQDGVRRHAASRTRTASSTSCTPPRWRCAPRRTRVKTAEEAADEQADLAAQQLANVAAPRGGGRPGRERRAARPEPGHAHRRRPREGAAQGRARQGRDEAELAKLKKQEEKIKQQILAARGRRTTAPATSAHDDGFLLAPVDGSVTSPFGYRIHPIYGYWGLHDGTDFGVSCGEGMRAVRRRQGDLALLLLGLRQPALPRRRQGQRPQPHRRLQPRHGYRVDVGDTVTRGEIVGYVGSTGWSTGCHLHFTVLQDGTAVDPMNYL